MQYTANSLENHWMPFTSNKEFKASPRLIVKGEGVYFTDHMGGTVIDGSSGLFCCPLGHGRKDIADAVHEQLLENSYASPFMTSTPGAFELAQK
ncbi:MAG: aspartate aminotransferase family protein, partial [Rhodospirillales bacterium]|nr:aspartate aminotransferase family protein [Rhodospirillales bacterium]